MSKNTQLANRNLVDWQANEQDKKKTDWVKLDTGETLCRNPVAVPENFTIDLSTYSGPVTCANPLGYAMSQATIYIENAPKMENNKEVELDVCRGAATTFTVTPSSGYTSMNEVDITLTNMPVYQSKTCCICTTSCTITPDSNYQGLSDVTVNVNAKCIYLQMPSPYLYPQTNCRSCRINLTNCFACEIHATIGEEWISKQWWKWESDDYIQAACNIDQASGCCYCCRFAIYTTELPQDDGTVINTRALLCVPAQFVNNCFPGGSGVHFQLADLAGSLQQVRMISATDKCHAVFEAHTFFACEGTGEGSYKCLPFHFTGSYKTLNLG